MSAAQEFYATVPASSMPFLTQEQVRASSTTGYFTGSAHDQEAKLSQVLICMVGTEEYLLPIDRVGTAEVASVRNIRLDRAERVLYRPNHCRQVTEMQRDDEIPGDIYPILLRLGRIWIWLQSADNVEVVSDRLRA